jgi:hypothetical protein
MRARLIHAAAGRLNESIAAEGGFLAAGRLPHGALAISAHLRRAAVFDGDFIPHSYSGRVCTTARL